MIFIEDAAAAEPNKYTVMLAMISTLGPILMTYATYKWNRLKSDAKAEEVKVIAVAQAAEVKKDLLASNAKQVAQFVEMHGRTLGAVESLKAETDQIRTSVGVLAMPEPPEPEV